MTSTLRPDHVAGEDVEPDLDLVEPRSVRWGEMERESSSSGDPLHDIRVFVQGQVIDNYVKVFVRMRSIQAFKKREKDMGVVAVHAAGFHGTFVNGECCEQTCRAMTGIGGRVPFRIAQPERQFRLSPIKCLDLRFLIHAQHQCVCREEPGTDKNGHLLGFKFRIGLLPHQW